MFVATVLASQIAQAQETTYLSNLGQVSIGSYAIGSDSWLGIPFITGFNASGYVLNSIQLAMTDASGSPSGFSIMIYNTHTRTSLVGSNLGALNSPLNPVSGGIYNYTPTSSVTLRSDTEYIIVLTAATSVVNNAYELSLLGSYSPGGIGNWVVGDTIGQTMFVSSNGSSWYYGPGIIPQFAITATPVPEPSAAMLLGCGGILFFGFGRWKTKLV